MKCTHLNKPLICFGLTLTILASLSVVGQRLNPPNTNTCENIHIGHSWPPPAIFIDGNSQLDAYCAGNGTDGISWASAHIIDDLVIDAFISFENDSIVITRTDRFLIIKNCTILRNFMHVGIAIYESANIKIINCTVDGTETGVRLDYCSNMSLINCTFTNNRVCGVVSYSNDTILDSNKVRGSVDAMTIGGCRVTVTNNIVSGSSHVGIQSFGNNITIASNVVTANLLDGVMMCAEDSKPTDYILRANLITDNGRHGLVIWSTGVLIEENDILNNQGFGIMFILGGNEARFNKIMYNKAGCIDSWSYIGEDGKPQEVVNNIHDNTCGTDTPWVLPVTISAVVAGSVIITIIVLRLKKKIAKP